MRALSFLKYDTSTKNLQKDSKVKARLLLRVEKRLTFTILTLF